MLTAARLAQAQYEFGNISDVLGMRAKAAGVRRKVDAGRDARGCDAVVQQVVVVFAAASVL
ncbi:hypothetical protein D3C77_767990 [compost metagenome]